MNNTNMKNPNNDAYWKVRGYKKHPKDWKDRITNKSKRQQNRENYIPSDGGITEPFWKEDY